MNEITKKKIIDSPYVKKEFESFVRNITNDDLQLFCDDLISIELTNRQKWFIYLFMLKMNTVKNHNITSYIFKYSNGNIHKILKICSPSFDNQLFECIDNKFYDLNKMQQTLYNLIREDETKWKNIFGKYSYFANDNTFITFNSKPFLKRLSLHTILFFLNLPKYWPSFPMLEDIDIINYIDDYLGCQDKTILTNSTIYVYMHTIYIKCILIKLHRFKGDKEICLFVSEDINKQIDLLNLANIFYMYIDLENINTDPNYNWFDDCLKNKFYSDQCYIIDHFGTSKVTLTRYQTKNFN